MKIELQRLVDGIWYVYGKYDMSKPHDATAFGEAVSELAKHFDIRTVVSYTDNENGRNAALNGGRGSGQTVRRITELYENKIADLKANFDYVLEGKENEYREERKKLCDDFENMKAGLESQIATLGERCNQLLKDKGDLTDELAKWKDEWQEQVQKATDEGWERTKLTGRVRELEQENNKLLDVINNQDVKIADLEQQIERMKVCSSCDFIFTDGNCYYDKECKNKDHWKLRR